MKKILITGILALGLLISIHQGGVSRVAIDIAKVRIESYHSGAVINAPDSILPAFLLPENHSNQAQTSKNPVMENRLIRPGFSSLLQELNGKLHSAIEYFEICDQIFLRLNISAIIFPFDYHW